MDRSDFNKEDLRLFLKRWYILIIICTILGIFAGGLIKGYYTTSITLNIKPNDNNYYNLQTKEGIANYRLTIEEVSTSLMPEYIENGLKAVDNNIDANKVIKNISLIENPKMQNVVISYKSSNQNDASPILKSVASSLGNRIHELNYRENISLTNYNQKFVDGKLGHSIFGGIVGCIVAIGIGLFLNLFIKNKNKKTFRRRR
ncbi:MAG: hypothetical protein ACRC57_06520 [Sarcina sp.]